MLTPDRVKTIGVENEACNKNDATRWKSESDHDLGEV